MRNRAHSRPLTSRIRGRSARVEILERRALLAGDVEIRFADGNLFVTGDPEANSIAIALEVGEIVVKGLDGTTINGQTDPFIATALSKDIRIQMRGGDDRVRVGGEDHEETVTVDAHEDEEPRLSLPGGLNIDMGDGADGVRIAFTTIDGDLDIVSDAGADTVDIGRGPTFGGHEGGDEHEGGPGSSESTDDGCGGDEGGGPPPDVVVGGSVRISTGDGEDAVKFAFAEVAGDLTIQTGSDADIVVTGRGPIRGEHGGGGGDDGGCGGGEHETSLDPGSGNGGSHDGRPADTAVAGRVRIQTGAGEDLVMMRNTEIGAALDVDAGGDSDALGLQRVVVSGAANLDTKSGEDVIAVLDSIFEDWFRLDSGIGDDLVFLKRSRFLGNTLVSTGAGDDELIALRCDFERPVRLLGGAGNNQLLIENTTFRFGPVILGFRTENLDIDVPTAWQRILDLLGGYLQGHA